MSEKPLFQKSDEQEAIYAPQELPEGTAAERRADVDEGQRSDTAGATLVPGAAIAGAGMGGTGPSSGGGTLSGVAPAVGAAALADVPDEEDETRRRDIQE